MASGDVYNVIWDHISARWMGNKAFPLVSNAAGIGIHNMDIQWTLLYEPNVQHAVGIGTVYVSEGSGMATTDDDAHHNMFITVDHRLPLNQSGRNVRWVNNSFTTGASSQRSRWEAYRLITSATSMSMGTGA